MDGVPSKNTGFFCCYWGRRIYYYIPVYWSLPIFFFNISLNLIQSNHVVDIDKDVLPSDGWSSEINALSSQNYVCNQEGREDINEYRL